jgi:hypothetical protein
MSNSIVAILRERPALRHPDGKKIASVPALVKVASASPEDQAFAAHQQRVSLSTHKFGFSDEWRDGGQDALK